MAQLIWTLVAWSEINSLIHSIHVKTYCGNNTVECKMPSDVLLRYALSAIYYYKTSI